MPEHLWKRRIFVIVFKNMLISELDYNHGPDVCSHLIFNWYISKTCLTAYLLSLQALSLSRLFPALFTLFYRNIVYKNTKAQIC